jgi:hypothetical protein
VVEAEDDFMNIQLEFTNPIYVSTAEIKCQIEVLFGDG